MVRYEDDLAIGRVVVQREGRDDVDFVTNREAAHILADSVDRRKVPAHGKNGSASGSGPWFRAANEGRGSTPKARCPRRLGSPSPLTLLLVAPSLRRSL